MKSSYQLNVRVSEETNSKFLEIVEYERSKLKMGRISKSEILSHIIVEYYKLVQKSKGVAN